MSRLSEKIVQGVLDKHRSRPSFGIYVLETDGDFGGGRTRSMIATPALGMGYGLADLEGKKTDTFFEDVIELNRHGAVRDLYKDEGIVTAEQGLTLGRLFRECAHISPATLMALVSLEFGWGSGDLEGTAEAVAVIVPGMRVQTLPLFDLDGGKVMGLVWPQAGLEGNQERARVTPGDWSFGVEEVRAQKPSTAGVAKITLGADSHDVYYQKLHGAKRVGVRVDRAMIAPNLPITVSREGLALPRFVPKNEQAMKAFNDRQVLTSSNGLAHASLTYVLGNADWFSTVFGQSRG